MLKRLAQVEVAICVVLLAIITGLVFVASVMRFFGHPLVWSVDLAQLLFIWVCFLGADKAMREKSHLGMEVPVKYLPYKYHLWVELACSVMVLAFLAVLAVKGYELTLLNLERTFGDSTLSYGVGDGGRAGGLRPDRCFSRRQHGQGLAAAQAGRIGLQQDRGRQERPAAAGALG